MENTKAPLKALDSDLKKLYKKYKREYLSKINSKKGVQVKLSLLPVLSENLTNDIMNISIGFVKKHKIKDNVVINKVVELNQKYIRKFNELLNS